MMSNLQSFVQHCAEDTAEVWAIWGNVPLTVNNRIVEWESCAHVCLHISELSTEYSQNEWEMFLFQSLRVSTDVTVTGEAKNGLPHSATSWCESKESGLSGVASSLKSRPFPPTPLMEEEVQSVCWRATLMFSLLPTTQVVWRCAEKLGEVINL